jgi:hypothetical protein
MPAETEAVSDAKEYRVIPYTAVPNGFLDNLMADCTGAEVKVVLYIARRTLGTKKGRANGSDAIALSQICDGIVKGDGTRLDRGTGLARAAVVEALRRLEFARIIERDRGNGRTPDTWRLAAGSSGPGRAVPGAGGLVGGVAAVTSEPRVGPCCATFGPRSLGRRRLGVWAKDAVTRQGGQESGPEAEKPAAAGAGRANG